MKCKSVKIISLEEFLYYIMFSLLISLKGLGLDEASPVFRLGLICSIFLFTAKIVIGRYSLKELVIIATGGLWGIYVFFNVGTFSILIYALLAFGMKNISVTKVMKVGTVVYTVCFFTTVTLAVFFNRAGVQVVHQKLGLGPLLRESLGYSHPNVLHVTYVVLMAFILFVCKKDNKVKTIIGMIVGSILVFFYSLSYTGLMISGVFICINLYFTYRNSISKIEQIIIKSIFPFCIFFSTIVMYFLDGKIYEILNKMLNNRIWAIKVFLYYYEQTVWGQKILKENYSLDNSFIFALAWYGIAFFAVVIVAYWNLIDRYLKENRRNELAIIISFLIAGITEQFLFNASIKNITTIFLGEVFFEFINGKGKEFSIGSKWNRIFNFNRKLTNLIKKNPTSARKSILLHFGMIILSLLIGCVVPVKQYENVYVNEKQCHCNGELVNLEQIEVGERTLVIGNMTNENQFYHFTKENSDLIEVNEIRYRISLSVYVYAILCLLNMRKDKRPR